GVRLLRPVRDPVPALPRRPAVVGQRDDAARRPERDPLAGPVLDRVPDPGAGSHAEPFAEPFAECFTESFTESGADPGAGWVAGGLGDLGRPTDADDAAARPVTPS